MYVLQWRPTLTGHFWKKGLQYCFCRVSLRPETREGGLQSHCNSFVSGLFVFPPAKVEEVRPKHLQFAVTLSNTHTHTHAWPRCPKRRSNKTFHGHVCVCVQGTGGLSDCFWKLVRAETEVNSSNKALLLHDRINIVALGEPKLGEFLPPSPPPPRTAQSGIGFHSREREGS